MLTFTLIRDLVIVEGEERVYKGFKTTFRYIGSSFGHTLIVCR